jgi:glycosyltransferase involved in cell wall biosynthesis
MQLSLVIPCYNESANLPLLLERCRGVANHPGCEVILVDNGSTDDTVAVLQELLPRYPGCRSIQVETNQGYGFGILAGLRAASGTILGWTHADLQTDPADALHGLSCFQTHGSRIFVKGQRFGRPLGDVAFTVGMSVFETVLLGHRFWDINAQPTMFHRTFFDAFDDPPHDFALDLFAYHRALRMKIPVHRFPVRFGERAFGTSHWNVDWKSKRRFIRRTLEFSLELSRRS